MSPNSSDIEGKRREHISPLQLPDLVRHDRTVFVAYPYKLYPQADYRRVYKNLASAFDVKFEFADEKITSMHILQKIADLIRSSAFGLYDISGWNPNVTLELGLAFGLNERAYIAIDPSKTDIKEVPSDVRGLDRIEYSSYAELEEGVGRLLGQELPVERTHEVENQLDKLRTEAIRLVSESEGLKINDLAKLLGVSTDIAKLVVKPLVGQKLEVKGATRAARYYLV